MAGVLDAVPYDGSPVIKDSKDLPLMPELSRYQWSEKGGADPTSPTHIFQGAGIGKAYIFFRRSNPRTPTGISLDMLSCCRCQGHRRGADR